MLKLASAYGAFTFSLLAAVVSQLLMKSRFEHLGASAALDRGAIDLLKLVLTDWQCWAAGILLVLGAGCWYLAMTRLPISFMLPLAALIAPVASVGAWVFLGEPLTVSKVAAISVVAAGSIWLASLQN
jgi:drug/metabolite transporter (DMT)-like permease